MKSSCAENTVNSPVRLEREREREREPWGRILKTRKEKKCGKRESHRSDDVKDTEKTFMINLGKTERKKSNHHYERHHLFRFLRYLGRVWSHIPVSVWWVLTILNLLWCLNIYISGWTNHGVHLSRHHDTTHCARINRNAWTIWHDTANGVVELESGKEAPV